MTYSYKAGKSRLESLSADSRSLSLLLLACFQQLLSQRKQSLMWGILSSDIGGGGNPAPHIVRCGLTHFNSQKWVWAPSQREKM